MSTLTKALQRIISWQQTYYAEDAYFSSGLTLHQIEGLTQDFPFKLPKEVSELYQYSYGTEGGVNLAPGFCSFHSLEQALEDCRSWIFSEVNSCVFDSSEQVLNNLKFFESWDKDKEYKKAIDKYPFNTCGLPLFYGDGKECYYVLCDKEQTDFSPVWCRFIGEAPIIYASSLTNLILTIAECYETGGYYVAFDEESGYWELEQDLEKIELIFHKYNPQ